MDLTRKENKLPIDVFPVEVQDFISELGERYQCPDDYIIAGVLAALVGAMGNRYTLKDTYTNAALMWLCVVGDVSTNKSEPISEALKPLNEMDSDNFSKWRGDMAVWESNGKKGTPPSLKQTIISDTTPEARNFVLSHNPDGLLLHADELMMFLDNLNRYTKSGEKSALLSFWSQKTLIVNRKSGDNINIERPFFGIVGTIQPDILKRCFTPEDEASGFLERWQFVFPERKPRPYANGYIPKMEISERWGRYIRSIADGGRQLRYTANAKKTLENWLNYLVDETNAEIDGAIQAYYGKIPKITERLALLIAVANGAVEVDGRAVSGAVEFAKYFIETFKNVLFEMRNEKRRTAKEIINDLVEAFPDINKRQLSLLLGKNERYVANILTNKQD